MESATTWAIQHTKPRRDRHHLLYVWNHIFSSTFRLFSKVNHSIFVSLLHTCSKLNLLQRYYENTTRSIGYFTCVRTKSAFD